MLLESLFLGFKYKSMLEKQEEFISRFDCEFKLSMFPFDMHVCEINISLVGSGEFTPVFDMSVSRHFNKPQTWLNYSFFLEHVYLFKKILLGLFI